MIFAAAIPVAEALAPYVVPAATGAVAALAAWVGLADKAGYEIPRLPTDVFAPAPRPVPVPSPDRTRYTAHLLASATAITALQFQRFSDETAGQVSTPPPGSAFQHSPNTPNPFFHGAAALISGLTVWAHADAGDEPRAGGPSPGSQDDSRNKTDYDAIHQACSAHLPGIALKRMVRFVGRSDGYSIPKDDLPPLMITGVFHVFRKGAADILSTTMKYLKEIGGVCHNPAQLTELDCANMINLAGVIQQIQDAGDLGRMSVANEDAMIQRISALIAVAQLESVVATPQGNKITMNLKDIQNDVRRIRPVEIVNRLKDTLRQYVQRACGGGQ